MSSNIFAEVDVAASTNKMEGVPGEIENEFAARIRDHPQVSAILGSVLFLNPPALRLLPSPGLLRSQSTDPFCWILRRCMREAGTFGHGRRCMYSTSEVRDGSAHTWGVSPLRVQVKQSNPLSCLISHGIRSSPSNPFSPVLKLYNVGQLICHGLRRDRILPRWGVASQYIVQSSPSQHYLFTNPTYSKASRPLLNYFNISSIFFIMSRTVLIPVSLLCEKP
jgi:hypothetical protein